MERLRKNDTLRYVIERIHVLRYLFALNVEGQDVPGTLQILTYPSMNLPPAMFDVLLKEVMEEYDTNYDVVQYSTYPIQGYRIIIFDTPVYRGTEI